MDDAREPHVVLLHGEDGDVEKVLGLAFVSRVESSAKSVSPVAVDLDDRSSGRGSSTGPFTSDNLVVDNFGSSGFRSLSRRRNNSGRGRSHSNNFGAAAAAQFSTGVSIQNPSGSRLKALIQRCLIKLRLRSRDNLRLSGIAQFLSSNDHPVLQEQAARALVDLSRDEDEARLRRILRHPQLLVGLIQLLYKFESPRLQIFSARSIANLAAVTEGEEFEHEVLERFWPDALLGLVGLLCHAETTMELHREAAIALGNVASTAQGGAIVIEDSRALAVLIRLLFMHDGRRGTQEMATRAILHLVKIEGRTQKLLESPVSLIAGLSGLLLDHSRPALQESVCRILAYLSATLEHAETIVHRSVHFPQLLERLIRVLILDHNPSAILPLSNLAINEEIQSYVANYENVLDAAMMVRSSRGRNYQQEHLALFLGNLSLAQANRRKIVECPGLLPAIVDMLNNDSDPDEQEQAAWTLSNLSRTEAGYLEVVMKIAEWPGIVGGLIHILGKEENPRGQEEAARVLANLSYVPENDPIIVRFPDACTSLVPLLSKSEDVNLQKEVTRALTNLTSIDGLSQLQVDSECITRLASLILQYSSPGYRSCSRLESEILEQAALALGNLTLDENNRWKVSQDQDAVAALLGLLLRFEYPSVQEKAAWALTSLYKEEYSTTAPVPTRMPQVIPFLRILLSMEQMRWRT